MIDYDFPLYRPPAEANNIIIQATYGCSHNACTFCSMYKSKKYEVRNLEELFAEVDVLASSYPQTTKVFLADGDALSLETSHLVKLLQYLKKAFVKLRRVSVYATAQNLLEKTQEELNLLYKNGLNLVYFGVETGNEELLKKINKGVKADELIQSLNKASRAKIKVSATVILGLGGKAFTQAHSKDTAKIINQTEVTYLSTLQLGLEEDVKEHFLRQFENFEILSDEEVLKEQRSFLEQLHPKNRVIFRSNHASNAFHLAGTFPKDKERLLREVDEAIKIGKAAFIPSMFRGF